MKNKNILGKTVEIISKSKDQFDLDKECGIIPKTLTYVDWDFVLSVNRRTNKASIIDISYKDKKYPYRVKFSDGSTDILHESEFKLINKKQKLYTK